MATDQATSTPARVRKTGLLKTVAGFVGIYLLWPLGLMRLAERLLDDHRLSARCLGCLLVLVMAAPFVGFLIGVCELVTGKPLRFLRSAWGRLKEWQQGLFSLLLICLAYGVLLLLLHWATGFELF